MPKRILVPALITTGIFGLSSGNLFQSPLKAYAQDTKIQTKDENQNEFKDKSWFSKDRTKNQNGGGQDRVEYLQGKRPRSNDLAFAKSLGVDTASVETAQSKLKEAERELQAQLSVVRLQTHLELINKAEKKNLDSLWIDTLRESYQMWQDDQRSLDEAIKNKDKTVVSYDDLRQKIQDDKETYKAAERLIVNSM